MEEAEFVLPVPDVVTRLTTLKAKRAQYVLGGPGGRSGWLLAGLDPAPAELSLAAAQGTGVAAMAPPPIGRSRGQMAHGRRRRRRTRTRAGFLGTLGGAGTVRWMAAERLFSGAAVEGGREICHTHCHTHFQSRDKYYFSLCYLNIIIQII